VNDLLAVFRMRTKDQVRQSHEWIVTALFVAVAVLPSLLWPPAIDGLHAPYSGWPSVCLFALLVAGMATDSFDRPLHVRALGIAGGMVLHLGLLVPIFEFVGHRLMNIDALSPAVAAPFWAATRAYAGFMVLTFAMRSSSIMVMWAEGAERAKVAETAQG